MPTSDAARDAQYDAILEWGVPDHAALQRLTGIESPTLVIQGDNDLMIPTKLSHLMADLIPDAGAGRASRRARRSLPNRVRLRTRVGDLVSGHHLGLEGEHVAAVRVDQGLHPVHGVVAVGRVVAESLDAGEVLDLLAGRVLQRLVEGRERQRSSSRSRVPPPETAWTREPVGCSNLTTERGRAHTVRRSSASSGAGGPLLSPCPAGWACPSPPPPVSAERCRLRRQRQSGDGRKPDSAARRSRPIQTELTPGSSARPL